MGQSVALRNDNNIQYEAHLFQNYLREIFEAFSTFHEYIENDSSMFQNSSSRRLSSRTLYVMLSMLQILKIGPLLLKENRKSKKKNFEKRGPQCLLSLSVCLSVCLFAACRPQFLA